MPDDRHARRRRRIEHRDRGPHRCRALQQLDEAVQRVHRASTSPRPSPSSSTRRFPQPHRRRASATRSRRRSIAGEIITPPAGAIGRGDAFMLQIADRADADVLSNDSFQEFHGQYDWLFDQGRLVGGKPVPHVGWVFMDRSPVRGPISRRSVSAPRRPRPSAPRRRPARAAKAADAPRPPRPRRTPRRPRPRRAEPGKAGRAERAPEAAKAAGEAAAKAPRAGRAAKAAKAAPAVEPTRAPAAERAGAPAGDRPPRTTRRCRSSSSSAPTRSGRGRRRGRAVRSHGAYVLVDGARCYLPLKNLADPPPRSAREVLRFGRTGTFVVHAFDPPRRGVDLAMPGVVPVDDRRPRPAGVRAPTEPTEPTPRRPVQAPQPRRLRLARRPQPRRLRPRRRPQPRRRPAKKAAAKKAPAEKKAAERRRLRPSAAQEEGRAKKSAREEGSAKRRPSQEEGSEEAAEGHREAGSATQKPPPAAVGDVGTGPAGTGTVERPPCASRPGTSTRSTADASSGWRAGSSTPARRPLHAGDEAGRRRVPGARPSRPRATRRSTTARGAGTASPSSAGSASTTRRRASPTASPPTPRPGCSRATCGGVRVMSVYVPNGRALDHEHYRYKLRWLDRLRGHLDGDGRARRDDVAVCGDFNIAPTDIDVWDPAAFVGVHPRDARPSAPRCADLDWGLARRVPRALPRRRAACTPGGTTGPATSTRPSACASTSCSATGSLADRVEWALIDRNARKGKQARRPRPRAGRHRPDRGRWSAPDVAG